MFRTILPLVLSIVFALTGCRDPMPCLDCGLADDDDDEDNGDKPLADLPCGGADLMTDSLNCGSCGNACVLYYDGTDYEAGACSDGVCGPGWSTCFHEAFAFETCAEVCTALGRSCVADGCSGYSGLLFTVDFDGWGCNANLYAPAATITGACDQTIPWTATGDDPREVMCCCDFE